MFNKVLVWLIVVGLLVSRRTRVAAGMTITMIQQAAQGAVAWIQNHLGPFFLRLRDITIVLMILAAAFAVAGIFIPEARFAAIIVFGLWLWVFIMLLRAIRDALTGFSFTTPGPVTVTVTGNEIANVLHEIGKPFAVLLMAAGCVLMQLKVFPGRLSWGLIISLIALSFVMTSWVFLTKQEMKWIVRFLIGFYIFASVIGAYQGIVEMWEPSYEFHKSVSEWIDTQVLGRKEGRVERSQRNRGKRAQIGQKIFTAYEFSKNLWDLDPNYRGRPIKIFSRAGTIVPNVNSAIQTLESGNWYPTGETVPNVALQQLYAELVVVANTVDRSEIFVVPVVCLKGYLEGRQKSASEAIGARRQQAAQKRSLLQQQINAGIDAGTNAVQIRNALFRTAVWYPAGSATPVPLQVGMLAQVFGRTGDVPGEDIGIPVVTPPAIPDVQNGALYIRITDQTTGTSTDGWIRTEFCEFIPDPTGLAQQKTQRARSRLSSSTARFTIRLVTGTWMAPATGMPEILYNKTAVGGVRHYTPSNSQEIILNPLTQWEYKVFLINPVPPDLTRPDELESVLVGTALWKTGSYKFQMDSDISVRYPGWALGVATK